MTTFDDLANQTDPSKGASLVGYRLDAVGTSGRTLARKFDDQISLMEFTSADPTGSVNSSSSFNAAAAYSRTTGKAIHVPSGTYRVDNEIDLSDTRWVFDPGVVLNGRNSNTANLLPVRGSAGARVYLGANATRGDTVVTFAAPHGLVAGDWFLLTSQRACSHPDAGEWQLGTTTASDSHCYFAEPCQVLNVTNATTVVLVTPLIFPDYRIDRSEETLAATNAPPAAYMRRITFATLELRGFPTVLARNGNAANLRLVWAKDVYAEMNFEFGTAAGSGVNAQLSYNSRIKSRSVRPYNGTISNMASYNTYKYTSCWYGEWEVEESYGSQVFDQSYAPVSGDTESNAVCCIQPRVVVTSFYPRYQGMTTHGNTYGITAEVTAICPTGAGMTNRARFADLKVTSIGQQNANSAPAVSLSEWGVQDLNLEVHSRGHAIGLEFKRSSTTIDDSPRSVRANITGTIIDPLISAIVFGSRANKPTEVPNQIRFHDMKWVNVNAAVKSSGWWHGLHFDGIDVTVSAASTEADLFNLGDNSAWNTARNINILGGGIPVLFKYPTLGDSALLANVQLAWDIDWATINTVNNTSAAVSQGYSGYPAAAVAQRTIQNRWFNRIVSLNLSNNESARTLTLIAGYDNAMPVGTYIEFVNRAAVTLIIAAGEGITIAGASGEIPIINRVIKVYRAAATVYVVSATP